MKKKILCIDDSNSTLILLEYVLKKADYETLLTESVDGAIEILKEQVPDLILLDLSMPGVSGYDLLKMKDQLKIKETPIIVISAFDSPESKAETKKHGVADFVPKPLNVDVLLNKIKEYLT
jgi:DNA-binding response OmpR family regulator